MPVVSARSQLRSSLLAGRGDVRKLEALETEIMTFALRHYRGQMSEVSRKLGIGRSTLYRKLKDYGLIESENPTG